MVVIWYATLHGRVWHAFSVGELSSMCGLAYRTSWATEHANLPRPKCQHCLGHVARSKVVVSP